MYLIRCIYSNLGWICEMLLTLTPNSKPDLLGISWAAERGRHWQHGDDGQNLELWSVWFFQALWDAWWCSPFFVFSKYVICLEWSSQDYALAWTAHNIIHLPPTNQHFTVGASERQLRSELAMIVRPCDPHGSRRPKTPSPRHSDADRPGNLPSVSLKFWKAVTIETQRKHYQKKKRKNEENQRKMKKIHQKTKRSKKKNFLDFHVWFKMF